MGELSRYILGIVGAAMIVGILGSFPFGDSTKKLVRLVSGLVLLLVLLRPVVRFDWEGLIAVNMLDEGEAIAAQGQAVSSASQLAIIKEATEAYILDKAAGLQTALAVEIRLDEDGIPAAVTLTGTPSPYARARLAEIIAQDLGIPKEHQQWKN